MYGSCLQSGWMEESRHNFRSLGFGCFEGLSSIGRWPLPRNVAGSSAGTSSLVLVLVLVLIKDDFFIKRMLATWHPYTRASFLCQWLKSDTGKRMLSSPPASPLPKYGRNRIRAGRRTKTQPKRVIRTNVYLVRNPCHNLAYDTETVSTYREPDPSKRYQAQPRY